jgi:hypothetical protein
MFNAVYSFHAADVESVSYFIPNPVIMSASVVVTASVIHARNTSKLAGRDVTKISLQHIHTQKSPRVLNQAIVLAKLSFHHVQCKPPPCH